MRCAKPFDDGRLAHAGFADQRRVVLRPPRENLDDAFDFLLAPDDRIQFAFLGFGGQVGGQLIDHRRFGFFGFGRGADRLLQGVVQRAVLQDPPRLAADLLGGNSQPAEDVRRGAFRFEDQAEQQMLRADILMTQLARFLDGVPDNFFGARGKLYPVGNRPARRDEPVDHFLDPLFLQAEIAQHTAGHSAFFLKQRKEEVFSADFMLVHALGLLMGEAEHPAGTLGKTLQTFCHSNLPFRPN